MHPEITQREVAKRLKLSPSAVNLWEAGKTEPSAIVLVSIGRASDPVIRKYIREGRDDLLVGDDMRFPTYRLSEGAKIIGRVTEVTIRKTL